ncbi:MAG: 6-carboxytetrahydropterin synthase QueD [Candidatus Latescibacteria bacterium]|nr:6-carboxytetrahydropterin synthase QueD [Candidatus Latescibacterota bacterium]NIM66447.1 6-carboxytetrahydropterin synthase QueD [Candidatus Latescibacterota bacterium]NIO02927.1 6-carboxytetrahydropterin synthase QueD [Candidatus Latescibacterota bacterium]NIO30062.1 6-carboxytetrahydropterin synthase QueD [Candidatus Latescibacterota bacterium]NIO57677.1 6-carboxytetrahydropterin synthase QueD [Candidatus Latescibacterota bacterium]
MDFVDSIPDPIVSERYVLSVEGYFSASHTLPDCPPCDRLHGHTWKVRASWAFTELDDQGMGKNFVVLKEALSTHILETYDHGHLNDLEPFDRTSPTAENLAREFFFILKKNFDPGTSGSMERVEVWEGSGSCAAFEG